jgi:hypothetical protein
MGFVAEYAHTVPGKLSEGDVFVVSAALILAYILVLVINKLTGLIIFFLKKASLLLIVALAFYRFVLIFFEKIALEGYTGDNIALGAVGFIMGAVSFAIALYAALRSLNKISKASKPSPKPEHEQDLPSEKIPGEKNADFREFFSIQSVKNDKSVGAVLSYIIIAQFGVFSSRTISAPSAQVGILIFGIFLVAALAFIRQSYANYLRGLRHLGLTIIFGGAFSILLGHFWGNYPLDELLSAGYFATDSLVALITSISVSLFMSGKG